MILNEGGNVFADAMPFDHKDVPEILNTVNGALDGTGIRAIPVGSAATPTPGKQSGDMDVIVDEKSVLDFFKAKDAKTARKALNDYIAAKGLQTAQSGINVHVRVPVGNEAHQVDIMVAGNAERVAKFHTHKIPQGSPYKGVNKQLMLAILAKSKGYMWSAWQGLFDRNAEGKKGEFVTDDLDAIAQLLFGNEATAEALGSVESILQALPKDQAEALLARAKEDPNWKEIAKEAIDKNVGRVPDLLRSAMDDPVVAKYAKNYVRIDQQSSDEEIFKNLDKFMEINPNFPIKSSMAKFMLIRNGVSKNAVQDLLQARDEYFKQSNIKKVSSIKPVPTNEGSSDWFRQYIDIASTK